MKKEITVYTDELGKSLWENDELLEARRTPDNEEGFIIPIIISMNNIVSELDVDIIDVKKTITT